MEWSWNRRYGGYKCGNCGHISLIKWPFCPVCGFKAGNGTYEEEIRKDENYAQTQTGGEARP